MRSGSGRRQQESSSSPQASARLAGQKLALHNQSSLVASAYLRASGSGSNVQKNAFEKLNDQFTVLVARMLGTAPQWFTKSPFKLDVYLTGLTLVVRERSAEPKPATPTSLK